MNRPVEVGGPGDSQSSPRPAEQPKHPLAPPPRPSIPPPPASKHGEAKSVPARRGSGRLPDSEPDLEESESCSRWEEGGTGGTGGGGLAVGGYG